MHTNIMGFNFQPAYYRQLFATITVNLVSFSFGIYTGWTAMVTPLLKDPERTPLENYMTENSISWACSWGSLSAILGTFFWGLLADKFGRKVTGHLTMVPYLISWVILLGVKTETALMVSRFLGGLGASGAAINNPMYVGEISDAHMKDGLGSLFILMYNFGVLYVYVCGIFAGYDMLNIACLAVSVLFVIAWCYAPESPVFLIQRGDMEGAKKALKWLRGKESDKEVEEELDAMTHRGDRLTTAKWSDYLEKGTLKALLIGAVFQAGTQLSGINIILMYTVEIFQESGSALSPVMCTMFVGVVQVIGSVLAVLTVKLAGRKFFLILTYTATAVALITIGWCFDAQRTDHSATTGWLPVLSMSLHVIAFSMGLGMVPYIIYTEIFPANVRNMCMSALMFWNNALGFGIVKAYPHVSESIHISGCFWLLGSACLAVVPFTYFFVPETKDKSFEAIQRKLLLWFPDLQRRSTGDRCAVAVITLPMECNKVVVVNATSGHNVYIENDQTRYAEP
ncbi:facilitated trehalose transporter Tret1-2 homolog [Sipha flava]|uniref:Facilitated trehalose transporter Tret1-2 homolog n=1 Tax=Sipha flava TaxID=143950 RepID=A0A8B8FUM5_9HEMI|nr:facilitated trehalose transporter Tret1-2 homolog [Sipha flava]